MVVLKQGKPETIKLRKLGLIPQGLKPIPDFPEVIRLQTTANLTFAHVIGTDQTRGNEARVTDANQLSVTSNGSDFEDLTTASGTAPASFSSSHEVSVSTEFYLCDILVESQEAEIRFQKRDGTFTDAIPLLVGVASIGFRGTKIQIRARGATAGTYHITAYHYLS